MRTTMTALIHGVSGCGKSWLGDTVPAPRLIIDLEGRAKYTPSGPKIVWDPRQGPPPMPDGTWVTCVVSAPDFETLSLVFQWLRSGQHGFVSVVIDSLMEAQKRAMDVVVPGIQKVERDDWGELLRRLEKMVRAYRDLTLVANNTMSVVILLVGSRNEEKGWQPMLQGQLKDTVPYYVDLVGYLFKAPQPDGTFVRSMLIDQQPGFLAKDNTDRLVRNLGPIIPIADVHTGQPGYDLGQLLQLLHVNGKPEALATEGVT